MSNRNQILVACNEAEANDIKQRSKMRNGKALFTSLIRYQREEVPRHKRFEVEPYKINGWLEDAGLERQDLRMARQ